MDAFRALAALIVVASHLRDLLILDYAGQTGFLVKTFYFFGGLGHAGVMVFFVLSGFWIGKTVARRVGSDTPFWAEYLVDRLTRLVPVLLLALVFGGLVDWLGTTFVGTRMYAGTSGALSLRWDVGEALNVMNAIGTLSFLQGIITSPFGSNGPLWSLSFEFWYYIWFPALYLSIRRRTLSPWLLSFALGMFAPHLAIGFVSWLMGYALFRGAHPVVYQVLSRRIRWVVLLLGLALFCAMLVAFRLQYRWWMDPFLAMSFSIVLFGLLGVNPPIPKGLGIIARYGATTSFSLYASHLPVVVFLSAIALDGSRLEPNSQSLILLSALLIVAVLLSIVFARVTERKTPAMRLRVRRAMGMIDRST